MEAQRPGCREILVELQKDPVSRTVVVFRMFADFRKSSASPHTGFRNLPPVGRAASAGSDHACLWVQVRQNRWPRYRRIRMLKADEPVSNHRHKGPVAGPALVALQGPVGLRVDQPVRRPVPKSHIDRWSDGRRPATCEAISPGPTHHSEKFRWWRHHTMHTHRFRIELRNVCRKYDDQDPSDTSRDGNLGQCQNLCDSPGNPPARHRASHRNCPRAEI